MMDIGYEMSGDGHFPGEGGVVGEEASDKWQVWMWWGIHIFEFSYCLF